LCFNKGHDIFEKVNLSDRGDDEMGHRNKGHGIGRNFYSVGSNGQPKKTMEQKVAERTAKAKDNQVTTKGTKQGKGSKR